MSIIAGTRPVSDQEARRILRRWRNCEPVGEIMLGPDQGYPIVLAIGPKYVTIRTRQGSQRMPRADAGKLYQLT